MKESKDNETYLFPTMAEMYKIRENDQDLQLERSRWHIKKNFFMRRIAHTGMSSFWR